jgi:hypothetical protein
MKYYGVIYLFKIKGQNFTRTLPKIFTTRELAEEAAMLKENSEGEEEMLDEFRYKITELELVA